MNVFHLRTNLVKAKTISPIVYYIWGEKQVVEVNTEVLVNTLHNLALVNDQHIEIFSHEYEKCY